VPDFAHGRSRAAFIGIDPDREGVGAPGTLLGVVPDDVVAVDVKVRPSPPFRSISRSAYGFPGAVWPITPLSSTQ
jgi:hypothetical protein